MRILHVYKDYFPVIGGIENHVRSLAEDQASKGHDVSVLTFSERLTGSVQRERGVRVIRASRLATVASMPLGPTYPFLILREKADVCHVHMPFPLGALANLWLGRSRATVVTYHADIVRQRRLLRLYRPLQIRAIRNAGVVLTTSAAYRESSDILKAADKSVEVVPLGVDADRFSPANHLGRDVLFVGKFRHYKGLDLVLDAAERMPGARFTLAGDGPELERIRSEILSRGLEDRIATPGFIPDEDLPELYRRHRCFVLPATSRAEAFGTVLLEAMASGLPVVTTDVGSGSSWVVEDGVTGFVVQRQTPEALAAALDTILNDNLRAAALGRAGRARVMDQFSLEAMHRGVMDLYLHALGEEPDPAFKPS